MKTRIITAVVALAIFLPILIFADTALVSVGGITVTLFNLAIALLSTVGVFEAVKCVGEHKRPALFPVYPIAFLLPLITTESLNAYTPVFIALLFYILFVAVIRNADMDSAKALTLFALTFYVTAAFGTMAAIYNTSIKLFPLIFVGAWVTDTFAYFSGFFFGKKKLIPEVSPKKTVEGAIGGSLATTVTFALYAYFTTDSILSGVVFAGVGLVASIVSQFGDLAASLIKRNYGIKDYGSLFPGHGGVLDRFDSILAVSSFLYLVSIFVKF